MLSFSQPISRGNAAVRGLLAAALGATLIVWPGITIGTVVVLFAVSVFADAIVSSARAFGDGRRAEDRWLLGLRAVIDITAGVVALAHPSATLGAMTVVIGLFALAIGITELSGSRTLRRLGASGTGWLVASGVLSVLTGLALVVWPSIGAVTLAVVFGAYLALSGLTLLISAAVTPSGEPVVAS
jgi:uncharacterized membrane protein HdeD (DUF308 family)